MLLALLFPLGAIAAVVAGQSVSVGNPLNAQLPPVARVGEPFSWQVSKSTFNFPGNTTPKYSVSGSPAWLAFDPSTLTFHGSPSSDDVGTQEITLTAEDSEDAASSQFDLLVTDQPAPRLRLSILDQFRPDNPSLASVFLLSENSALKSTRPALRVPPKWSFSIGLEGSTFTSPDSLYYAALQADGSPLPSWIRFNPKAITFDGFTPGDPEDNVPQVFSLVLHASDQQGYSSSSLPFDLIVAAHELSSTPPLPTLNVTADTSFEISLSSPADFTGVLVDGKPIQPSEVTSLIIDTSRFKSWLEYDSNTRTLKGKPPKDIRPQSSSALPVTLATSFNQSIQTEFSLAIVPSFFTSEVLPPILYKEAVGFNLHPYFSNATKQDDVKLTAAFQPDIAGNWLTFNAGLATLTGTIPLNVTSAITVTFTAYSHITHSTSHTSFTIDSTASDFRKDVNRHHASGLSVLARKKLVLGLSIAFGIIGGAILFGLFLAAFRRCARVPDTAIGGMHGWTASDRKWYDVGVQDVGNDPEQGYGWTEKLDRSGDYDTAGAMSSPRYPGGYVPAVSPRGAQKGYGDLGIRRILTRSPPQPGSGQLSPRSAVMRKASFLDRIKQSVRVASDKYTQKVSVRKRPVIGKPAFVSSTRGSSGVGGHFLGIHAEQSAAGNRQPARERFTDIDASSFAVSAGTTISGSPSSSTGGASIPTRRPDLQPTPRQPPAVHFMEGRGTDTRPNSTNSSLSSSDASVRTHATEAVVYTASRATSVGSGRAVSSESLARASDENGAGGSGPARIMPFTKSSRVPVPGTNGNGSNESFGGRARVVSQRANIVKAGGQEEDLDDFSVGARYVRELGGDDQGAGLR